MISEIQSSNENALLPESGELTNPADEQRNPDSAPAGTPESDRAREEVIRNMPAYLRRLG